MRKEIVILKELLDRDEDMDFLSWEEVDLIKDIITKMERIGDFK